MKIISFSIILFLFLISCNNDLDSPEIKSPSRTSIQEVVPKEETEIVPFVSEKGRFSVQFPGKPKEYEHTTTSEIGEIKLTQFIYALNDTKAWLVSYSDYPEKMIRLGNSDQLLKGIKVRLLQDLQADLVAEEKIKLENTYDGLSFVGYAERKKLDILYKIYLVKNRVYQVSMYSSVGHFSPQDSTDFMGSFKLLKKEENPT